MCGIRTASVGSNEVRASGLRLSLKNYHQPAAPTEQIVGRGRPIAAQRVCGGNLCLHGMLCPEIIAKRPMNLSLRPQGTYKSGVRRGGRCQQFPRRISILAVNKFLSFNLRKLSRSRTGCRMSNVNIYYTFRYTIVIACSGLQFDRPFPIGCSPRSLFTF